MGVDRLKHWHVYDTTGEVMCVDADGYRIPDNILEFFIEGGYQKGPEVLVAQFNWSNVVCVREEEDDDEGDESVPLPDWVPEVTLN